MKPSFKNALLSVTGKPLIQHPGLTYPAHVIQLRKGFRPETGRPYTVIPKGGINTREVADLLACSMSGARQYLHRKKIRFVLCRRKDGALECFWDKEAVLNNLKGRCPIVDRPPKDSYTTAEAMSLLGMARSALYRMSRKGLLVERKIRIRTKKGIRVRCYYSRKSVHVAMQKKLKDPAMAKHGFMLPEPS